jgi:predicted RNA-binding protein Jag
MYDAKSEANEFVGDNRRDAVAKACRFFGTEEGELRISEPDPVEIFGLGARAVVVAVPKNAKPPTGGGGGDREPREGRGREGRGRGRSDRGDRGERSDRGDRGERNDRSERSRGRDASSGGERDSSPVEREKAPRAEVGESKGVAEGKIGDVGTFILGTVERMKLGGFSISESVEEKFVVYELKGEAATTLGSGDGRAAEALQLLANQAAMITSDEAPRVVVDIEGDAERRETFLARLATRAAERSSETKRSVALDPMNARDRRMLHMAIKEIDECATMSVGSGRYRQVVVVSKGCEEYEEALESAKAVVSS